jgi:hypothetical protein
MDVRGSLLVPESRIEFSPEESIRIFNKAKAFAKAVGSGKFYDEHRSASKSEIDIRDGKIGEFMLDSYLINNLGYPSDVGPDCEVHKVKDKKWGFDLDYNAKYPEFPSWHCKTCTPSTISILRSYNVIERGSWTFQGHDPLLKRSSSTEMIGLVFLEDANPIKGYVVVTSPWNVVCNKLRNPVVDKYIGQKFCAYFSDLVNEALVTA